jgi:hypothetical protein
MKKWSFPLWMIGLVLLLVACGRAELPPVEKVYQMTDLAGSQEVETGNEGIYQAEIEALTAWAAGQGSEVQLRPASQTDLEWLLSVGVPESVWQFFTRAEPASSLEAEGVYLLPIAQLRESNTAVEPGQTASKYGCIVIAETVSGDVYCMDVQQLDSEGQPPVYLVNHNQVHPDMTLQEFQANSRLVTATFRDFLGQFTAGTLPYDFEQATEIANQSQSENGYDQYIDENGRFQLWYPDTWLIAGPEGTADQVYFVNPSLGNKASRVIVTVMVQGPTRDLVNVANAADDYIRQQEGVENFQQASQIGVEVNGLAGIERIVTYSLNSLPFSQRTLYLNDEAHTFVLNLTTPGENLEQYDSTFEEIVRSFTTATVIGQQ